MLVADPTGSPDLGQPFRVILAWTQMVWLLLFALIRSQMRVAPGRA